MDMLHCMKDDMGKLCKKLNDKYIKFIMEKTTSSDHELLQLEPKSRPQNQSGQ